MAVGFSGLVKVDGAFKASNPDAVVELDNLFMSFDAGLETGFTDGQTIPDAHTFASSDANNTITSVSEGGASLQWHSANGGYVEFFASGRAIRSASSDYTDLNNATSLSVASWTYNHVTARKVICSRWQSGQAQQWNHLYEGGTAGRFWYDSRGAIGGTFGATDAGLYSLNEWHHIVWMYDVSDGITRWYVNGVEEDTRNWGTDSGNGMSVGSFTTPIGIGTRSDIHETLDGFIATVKVYTDALTPTEISDMFNNEKSRFGL